MRCLASAVGIALFCGGCGARRDPAPVPAGPLVVRFINARWFSGTGFGEHPMLSVGGMFAHDDGRPAALTVDLKGGFALPPFAEAHNHNLISDWTLKVFERRYRSAGILYVQIPGAIAPRLPRLRHQLDSLGVLSVSFGTPGFTAPGGHPAPLHRRLALSGAWAGLHADSLEGVSFFSVRDSADVDDRWNSVVSMRPDFVKTLLLFAEDSAPARSEGLDAATYRYIVRRAHAAGLRVMTHVETARDFAIAVDGGTDIVAHVPGYSVRRGLPPSNYLVDIGTARRAASRSTALITTTLWSQVFLDTARRTIADDLQRTNLRTLLDAGVPIAIGSDVTDSTSVAEIHNLARLGVMDNTALLRAWTHATPRLIHPRRHIGAVEADSEASFVVLVCDPIIDLRCVDRIKEMYVRGRKVP